MFKNRWVRWVVALVLVGLLAGCFFPEKFTASVVVHKDGSYEFTYDGTLAHGMALVAEKQGGLAAKDEATFAAEAAKMQKNPTFRTVVYEGKGRYKVLVKKEGKRGETYYFPGAPPGHIFGVVAKPDGTLTISAPLPDAKGMKDIQELGATFDGTLTVTVESGATVVSDNAQEKPGVLWGGYKWVIKGPDANPSIVIRPAAQ